MPPEPATQIHPAPIMELNSQGRGRDPQPTTWYPYPILYIGASSVSAERVPFRALATKSSLLHPADDLYAGIKRSQGVRVHVSAYPCCHVEQAGIRSKSTPVRLDKPWRETQSPQCRMDFVKWCQHVRGITGPLGKSFAWSAASHAYTTLKRLVIFLSWC